MTVNKDAAVPHQTFEVTLAITMVIIAMIAIFVYPNFENARNRGRQRRMMGDIRAIARAVESYHEDFKVYPTGKTSVENIRNELEPYLEEELPVEDGWGNKYVYLSDGIGSYTVMSFGKDKKQDGMTIYRGIAPTFENDVVFSNGSFITVPDECCFVD
jgi:type II secretory pathway pseudopilin PulG